MGLYMFRAYRHIFRRVPTAVHTTIGSVSVPFRSHSPYVVDCPSGCSLLCREEPLGQATTYGARDLNGTDTEPMVV